MAHYIDISVPTSSTTTVFPGDPPSEVHWPHWSREKGDPANVGFFHGGLHHGTHVDAPWHFIPGAKRLDEVPLDRWLGACWVVDCTKEPQCVSAQTLEQAGIPPEAKRLLFKTRNSQCDYWQEPWNPDFIYIDRSAAQWCVSQGVLTVGHDYLTVDSPAETEFPTHTTLLGNDIVLIENLMLRNVDAGWHELLAAPIKLPGADAAWCRALLRTEE